MTSDRPGPARVLIADDDAHNRKLLGEVCASEGYEIDTVDNGRSAVELVGTVRYDLVLLDAAMPELSGYEVLELVRADPRTAGVPIIMVTANPHEGARRRAVELGVFAYVEKPFRLFDLTQRMRLALRRPRGDGEPTTTPSVRARRALGDVLPHLPSPNELRPALRRAVDEAWANSRDVCCGVLRFQSGPALLADVGRTARDAALGAMIVHLAPLVIGAVHRADDDELIFVARPSLCDLLPGLVDDLSQGAAEAVGLPVERVRTALGVCLLEPQPRRADVDALLRSARALAARAATLRPAVVVDTHRD